MANKKLMKLGAIALFGVLGLAACSDDIIAKPTDYNDKIITGTEKIEGIFNNDYEKIYEGIRDGSLASDVLDELLYTYAKDAFGDYDALKAAAEDTIRSNQEAFVKNHRAYWDDPSADEITHVVNDTEIARMKAKFNTIEKRIKKEIFDDIKGGSYSEDNYFSEETYLAKLHFASENVKDYKTVTDFKEKCMFLPEYDEEDVFDKFVHREYIDGDYSYIKDTKLPDIYRHLLVEQYILEETYNTLGRSYARKVNIIAIANNDKHSLAAPLLMKQLAKSISTNTAGLSDDYTVNDLFQDYYKAWNGADVYGTGSNVENIISSVNATRVDTFPTATTKDGEKYYQATKYGDMLDEYSKIDANPLKTDSSLESTYTGSGDYTYERGLALKKDQIKLNDYVTDGWYIKGGLSSLPSTISDRLFSSYVAQALDNTDYPDRYDGTGAFNAERDGENKYVAKINGRYYLKTTNTEQHSATDADARSSDILFYDSSSSTYYVVEIEEAVNSAKLAKSGKANYTTKGKNEVEMQDIVNEVLNLVGEGDTYQSLAKEHWLEKMELEYHDTVVYDYFESNFPDLFDDDDD